MNFLDAFGGGGLKISHSGWEGHEFLALSSEKSSRLSPGSNY